MLLLFCISFALTGYAYLGYPVLLTLLRRKAWRSAPWTPTVSVVMAVRNEGDRLAAKIENLLSLDYPRGKVQIIVVSDGSSDHTVEVLERQENLFQPVVLPHSVGKASALNAGVRYATGEILVLCDVRQMMDEDALRHLVACFADPAVGAASGELLLETAPGVPAPDALGLYWRIEKAVRRLESSTGSVVGMTGAICALRRRLFVDLPQGTLLDDVLIPMNVARAGFRVVFQPLAIARDRIFTEKGREFRRKVRTLTGNYQLLQLAPWLLTFGNPLLFRLVSHKLLRLVVPVLLVMMFFSSGLDSCLNHHFWLRAAFVLQLVFYGLAALGTLSSSLRTFKPVAIAHTFVVLNLAAALALRNTLFRRESAWS